MNGNHALRDILVGEDLQKPFCVAISLRRPLAVEDIPVFRNRGRSYSKGFSHILDRSASLCQANELIFIEWWLQICLPEEMKLYSGSANSFIESSVAKLLCNLSIAQSLIK